MYDALEGMRKEAEMAYMNHRFTWSQRKCIQIDGEITLQFGETPMF